MRTDWVLNFGMNPIYKFMITSLTTVTSEIVTAMVTSVIVSSVTVSSTIW